MQAKHQMTETIYIQSKGSCSISNGLYIYFMIVVDLFAKQKYNWAKDTNYKGKQ